MASYYERAYEYGTLLLETYCHSATTSLVLTVRLYTVRRYSRKSFILLSESVINYQRSEKQNSESANHIPFLNCVVVLNFHKYSNHLCHQFY